MHSWDRICNGVVLSGAGRSCAEVPDMSSGIATMRFGNLLRRRVHACACSGPSFAQALLRSARLGGNSAMVLRAALSAQAGHVSRGLGVRSGVEMRAARRAAEAVDAQIVLGD